MEINFKKKAFKKNSGKSFDGIPHYINKVICGTQEKESKGGPAVGWPRLRRTEHGCRGIPCFFFRRWDPLIGFVFIMRLYCVPHGLQIYFLLIKYAQWKSLMLN